ncbi:MAG: hypothetical protein IIT88_05140 [Acetobacter sp.]|nr:hypothetical protein [Acetobacter sp.]
MRPIITPIMRGKLLTTTLLIPCCAFICSPVVSEMAFATTITGPYVGVGAGIDIASAQHYRVSSEQQPDNGHPTAEEPPTGGGAKNSGESEPDHHTDSGDNGNNGDNDNHTPTKTAGASPTGGGTKNSGNKEDNGDQGGHTPPKKTSDNGTNDNGNKNDHSTSKTTSDGDPYTGGQKQPGYPYSGKPYHYSKSFYKSLQNVRCSVDGAGRSRSGQISASGNEEGQLLITPNGQPICMIPQEATDYVGQFGYRYALEPYGKIPSSWDFGETWPGLNPFTLDPGLAPSVLLGYFTPIESVFSNFVQHNSTANLAQSFDVGRNIGFAGFAAFGWGFGNGMRAEIEGLAGGIGGHHRTRPSYGGFINVLYDIDLQRLFGLHSIVTPFVGIGGGYLEQHYSNIVTVSNNATLFGTNSGFAWQGMAGIGIDTGVRGLQVTAQYSIIGQPKSLSHGLHYIEADGDRGIAKSNRFNNLFLVGLRYRFNAEPRKTHLLNTALYQSTAPDPTPTRSYDVFFDRNNYTLTARDQSILADAACASTHVYITEIKVMAKKNTLPLEVLKQEENVKAALIRDGVPASEIVIDGYGKIPPTNHRIEITYSPILDKLG